MSDGSDTHSVSGFRAVPQITRSDRKVEARPHSRLQRRWRCPNKKRAKSQTRRAGVPHQLPIGPPVQGPGPVRFNEDRMIPDPNQTTVSAVAQNEMRFCAREGDGDRLLSERNPVERPHRCAIRAGLPEVCPERMLPGSKPQDFGRSNSAICTALRAAPFRS